MRYKAGIGCPSLNAPPLSGFGTAATGAAKALGELSRIVVHDRQQRRHTAQRRMARQVAHQQQAA